MTATKCIVGLGNPGTGYAATRHNAGFLVLAELSHRLRCPLREGNGEYLIGRHLADDRETILLAPMTFMNNSGVAVKEVADALHLSPADLLVVLDDFQLPLGTLRLRQRGSDGGHNGLASILYHLADDEVPRLRIGIANADMTSGEHPMSMTDFVLSVFENEERGTVKLLIHYAADACLAWCDNGIDRAMSLYNKSFIPAPPSPPSER